MTPDTMAHEDDTCQTQQSHPDHLCAFSKGFACGTYFTNLKNIIVHLHSS